MLARVRNERHEIQNTQNRTIKRGELMHKIQKVYKPTAQNCPSNLLLEKREFMSNYEFATAHPQKK